MSGANVSAIARNDPEMTLEAEKLDRWIVASVLLHGGLFAALIFSPSLFPMSQSNWDRQREAPAASTQRSLTAFRACHSLLPRSSRMALRRILRRFYKSEEAPPPPPPDKAEPIPETKAPVKTTPKPPPPRPVPPARKAPDTPAPPPTNAGAIWTRRKAGYLIRPVFHRRGIGRHQFRRRNFWHINMAGMWTQSRAEFHRTG